MNSCKIDMELLISLVENRPVLWDKTIEIYKNKQANCKAWNEICLALNQEYQTLNDVAKSDFNRIVIKKWSHARDNWMRCAKKLMECKSGSFSKYKYYKQMQFLNKVVSNRPSVSVKRLSEDPEGSPSSAVEENITVPKKKKKREFTEENNFETKIETLVNPIEVIDNSRIMSFFRGIAPTIEKFNDTDIVEFQYEVMKTIRDINQRALSHYYL